MHNKNKNKNASLLIGEVFALEQAVDKLAVLHII